MAISNCCEFKSLSDFGAILIIRKSEYTIENIFLSIKTYKSVKFKKNSVIIQYCNTLPSRINCKSWSAFYITKEHAVQLEILTTKNKENESTNIFNRLRGI